MIDKIKVLSYFTDIPEWETNVYRLISVDERWASNLKSIKEYLVPILKDNPTLFESLDTKMDYLDILLNKLELKLYDPIPLDDSLSPIQKTVKLSVPYILFNSIKSLNSYCSNLSYYIQLKQLLKD
jgi:hypothetical protein